MYSFYILKNLTNKNNELSKFLGIDSVPSNKLIANMKKILIILDQ